MIDNLGFLVLDDKEKKQGDVLEVARIKGVKPIRQHKKSDDTEQDVCWIC